MRRRNRQTRRMPKSSSPTVIAMDYSAASKVHPVSRSAQKKAASIQGPELFRCVPLPHVTRFGCRTLCWANVKEKLRETAKKWQSLSGSPNWRNKWPKTRLSCAFQRTQFGDSDVALLNSRAETERFLETDVAGARGGTSARDNVQRASSGSGGSLSFRVGRRLAFCDELLISLLPELLASSVWSARRIPEGISPDANLLVADRVIIAHP